MTWQLRAAQLFAAAALSLVIAVALGLPNPFWAAMPVWVVAQTWRQDLLLRAVFRIAGTMIGAALGWGALMLLPDAGSRILFLGLAVGFGTALSFWIGTIYSYGVTLAAMTVAVVLVPAMDHPVDAAHLAMSRIWCTFIGVLAVTAITFLSTPHRTEAAPPRHTPDGRMVALRGTVAGGAAALGGLIVTLLPGPAGIAAALSLCIFSMVIGSAPNPAPILRFLPVSSAIGVAAALVYRALEVSLGIEGIPALAIAVAFIGAGALLRAHPRTAPLGLDANMCFLLVAEAGTAGHSLGAHVQGGAALAVTGVVIAAVFRKVASRTFT